MIQQMQNTLDKLINDFYNTRESRENIQIRTLFLIVQVLIYMAMK
jgi:hypothetical protein